MTVVAWDGQTLAADKRICHGESVTIMSKLFVKRKDLVLAFVGNISSGLMMIEWYVAGKNPEDFPATQASDYGSQLIVVEKGILMSYEVLPIPIFEEGRLQAWGTGRDLALGAMEMGADAVRAVEIASKYNICCGNGVDFYTFKKGKTK